MRVHFQIAASGVEKFNNACEAALINIGNATKHGCLEAASDIMMESLNQVPRETGTLASSAFIGVSRRTDTAVDRTKHSKAYRYGAVLGYGRYGGVGSKAGLTSQLGIEWIWAPINPRNPKHNLPVSSYAAKVHEGLFMQHPNGGKAKFLEDPVREWASGRFSRVMVERWRVAIEEVVVTTETSASNRAIAQAVKRGSVSTDMPAKPTTGKFSENVPYQTALSGYQTAKYAVKNPTSRSTTIDGKRTTRYINQRIKRSTTSHTTETWKGNK